MLLSIKNIKFYKNKILKKLMEDKNFSLYNFIKANLNTLKGEKVIKFNDKYIITSFLPPFPSRAFLSTLYATKEEGNLYTQNMYFNKSAPISFYVSLTNRCPYNCFHCSAKGRKKAKELTTEEWIKVLKDIQDMGTGIIAFTGGEPLLRKDLKELISAVDDRSVTYLFTSGIGLTPERAKLLKESGLFAIGISLDSYIPEKHNSKRGNDNAFSTALQAIRIASDAGLYTMGQTVVVKNDVSKKELFKLYKLAKRYGAHEMRVLEPIRTGELLLNTDEKDIFFTKKDRENLIKIQYSANRGIGMPKITTFANSESESKFGCGAGIQHSYITASGELLPCDFVQLSFGNVKDKSVKELWLEMNKVMGLPKKECFAQKICHKLQKESNGILPLDKEKSIKICLNSQSKTYPGFFKLMQGKNKQKVYKKKLVTEK